jgi:putative flippase GtrA
LEAAEQSPYSLVLGSRLLQENVPLRSRFGNTVTRYIYRLSTGLYVHDTQTGLRAFSKALIPDLLEIKGDRYEYEMNVLLEFSRKKIRIEEVGISTIYIDNNAASHFSTVKDSFRIYKEIIKFSASSFVSFLLDYGLFAILSILTAGLGSAVSIPLSNIASRIVSASANYTINKKLVFKSNKSIGKSALQYFVLAAVILIGNTLALSLFTHHLGMNQYGAKILTEVIFFTLSWAVQRFFIFKKERVVQYEVV